MIDWDLVEETIDEAKGIAFDTCHKIYVLMDDEQMAQMKEYEYDPLYSKAEMSSKEMFETVKHWYAESCSLKFVSAVKTMPEGEDPNLGFTDLIEQGATEFDECYICGEEGCEGECEDETCERCGDRNVWADELCRMCYEDDEEEDNE